MYVYRNRHAAVPVVFGRYSACAVQLHMHALDQTLDAYWQLTTCPFEHACTAPHAALPRNPNCLNPKTPTCPVYVPGPEQYKNCQMLI